MARGFESKSVADQQEQAAHPVRRRKGDDADPRVLSRRRQVELALVDVRQKLAEARSDTHREMLKRALASLEKDLAALR